MKTVRFLRDTDPEREGGPGFKAGDVHTLKDASARHWFIRGAVEYLKDEGAPASQEPPADTGEPTNPPADTGEPEVADGDAVESPSDVEGQDGDGAGERAEPAAKPAGGKGGGGGRKGGGNRG